MFTDDLKKVYPNEPSNEEGYLDPYKLILNGPNGGYGFNEERDYLLPLPIVELSLNPNLNQNPAW